MNINFPPVDEGYIKAKVEGGYYSNATEMVRDAIRRMREQDDQHARLLAALEIGERDITAGRTVPYTPDLLKQIEREARKHTANKRQAHPDVIP
ncbi:MAG TPA: type II toxin-antitoxin system ParD family antitoxin [Verrucomicrobiae bacterium]|nr:type II toxin-antitoxin system ParD family antitoxin [Verrucomicrobiae bacterium]